MSTLRRSARALVLGALLGLMSFCAPKPAQALPTIAPAGGGPVCVQISGCVSFCPHVVVCPGVRPASIGPPTYTLDFGWHYDCVPQCFSRSYCFSCVVPTTTRHYCFTESLCPGCYYFVLTGVSDTSGGLCHCVLDSGLVYVHVCCCPPSVRCAHSSGNFTFYDSDPVNGNGNFAFAIPGAGGAPEVNAQSGLLPLAVAAGLLMVVADRRRRRS